jgi:hypothetical protein
MTSDNMSAMSTTRSSTGHRVYSAGKTLTAPCSDSTSTRDEYHLSMGKVTGVSFCVLMAEFNYEVMFSNKGGWMLYSIADYYVD